MNNNEIPKLEEPQNIITSIQKSSIETDAKKEKIIAELKSLTKEQIKSIIEKNESEDNFCGETGTTSFAYVFLNGEERHKSLKAYLEAQSNKETSKEIKNTHTYEFIEKNENLKKAFSKYPLVDLAAGPKNYVFRILKLLEKCGCKKYIGIDRSSQYGDIDTEKFKSEYSEYAKGSDYKEELLTLEGELHGSKDIITFLQTLPDKSVNILLSGFDKNISNVKKIEAGNRYNTILLAEIARVTPDDGFYLDIESHPEATYNGISVRPKDFGFFTGKISETAGYHRFYTKVQFDGLNYEK